MIRCCERLVKFNDVREVWPSLQAIFSELSSVLVMSTEAEFPSLYSEDDEAEPVSDNASRNDWSI